MKLMTSPKATPTIVHAIEMPATCPPESRSFGGALVSVTVVVMAVVTVVDVPYTVVVAIVVSGLVVTVVVVSIVDAAPVVTVVVVTLMMDSISNCPRVDLFHGQRPFNFEHLRLFAFKKS